MKSKGSVALNAWLSRADTPSQRRLAKLLPDLAQPTISRHARGDLKPALRVILLYETIVGIPAESWLSDDELGDLRALRRGLRRASTKLLTEDRQ